MNQAGNPGHAHECLKGSADYLLCGASSIRRSKTPHTTRNVRNTRDKRATRATSATRATRDTRATRATRATQALAQHPCTHAPTRAHTHTLSLSLSLSFSLCVSYFQMKASLNQWQLGNGVLHVFVVAEADVLAGPIHPCARMFPPPHTLLNPSEPQAASRRHP